MIKRLLFLLLLLPAVAVGQRLKLLQMPTIGNNQVYGSNGSGVPTLINISSLGGSGITTNALSTSTGLEFISGSTFDGSAARAIRLATGAAATNLGFTPVANTTTVNGHVLSSNVTVTTSGTTNRISVTSGTTDPVIDISSSYVGQSSITTLGTIGTGTWNGTVVSPTYGGTGINNGSNTITLGGNLTTSGAFNTTLTVTGTTSVTLPTSGTLTTTTYADAKVADAITDGVTTIAPSENAVFDALVLKADATSVATNTTDITNLKKVAIAAGLNLLHFGDSFTNVGSNASTTAKRYTSTIDEALFTVEGNYGVSGGGVFSAVGQVYTNELLQNNATAATIMIGFNDVRTGGGNTKNYENIRGGHLAMIANHYLRTAVAANNGSVSTTGTWTTVSAGTYKDKASLSLSGLARTSSVSGSTLTYSFTGESLVVGCWGTDGTGDGAFTVSVDGTVLATFDPDNLSLNGYAARTQNAVVLFGLGGSTHTAVITTSSSQPTYIDYIGTLQAPNYAPPLLVGGLVKMDATGFALGSGSIAAFDAADVYVKAAVNVFANQGFPVVFVNTNKYYNTATDVSTTDHIHPNDIGHGHIARAFMDAIAPMQNATTWIAQGNTTTAIPTLRTRNDANILTQIATYGSGQGVAGTAGPSYGVISTTSAVLSIGSNVGSSTIQFNAGGATAADVKMTVNSAGNVLQSSASASTISNSVVNSSTGGAGYFAQSSGTTATTQMRVTNDNSLIGFGAIYGSSTASAGIFGPSDMELGTTATRMHVGSRHASAVLDFYTAGTASGNIRGSVNASGLWRLGDNTTGAGSWLTMAAGTSTVAPFGLTSGTDLSSPLAGKFYYNGTRLGFSPSTTIKRIALTNDAAPSNGQIGIGNGTDYTIATPTGSGGITVTPGSGTLDISIASSPTINSPTIATGVAANGSGLKHGRITTGSVSAGSTALITYTWTTPFADANYTVTADVVEATTSSLSMSIVHIESVTASAVTVRVINNAVGSLTGTVNLIAIHD